MKLLSHLFFCLIFGLILSCSSQSQKVDNQQKEQSTEQQSGRITIATFNIAWLGDGTNDKIQRMEEDYQHLASLIRDYSIEVCGLQEIENEKALEKLCAYLPTYEYVIGTSGGSQKLAVLYKSDVVSVQNNGEIDEIAVRENRTRGGLHVLCSVGNFDFRMLVLHLKSTSRYDSTDQLRKESFAIRREQSEQIVSWYQRIIQQSEQDIIVVGDFNDNPTKKNSSVTSITEDIPMEFLTQSLNSCNPRFSFLPNIDHIVVNESARKRYIPQSLFVVNQFAAFTNEETKTLSDHCPTLAEFDTSMEDND